MSVFESIKAGLKSFTSRDSSKDDAQQYVKSPFNADVGGELLHRYQLIWQELHDTTESTAKQAEEVDGQITKLFVHYDRQCELIGQLHEGVASLPVILNQLQELTDVLANLEEEYDKVEAAMIFLEDICEEEELQQAKMFDSHKLAKYQARKKEDLEKIKTKLAKEHARNMEFLEKKRQNQLRERHEAFQEAFTEDINYFREHGRLDRVSVSSTDSGKKTDLADITVEEDVGILDEFLASDEVMSNIDDMSDPATEKTGDTMADDINIPKVKSNDDLDPDLDYFEDDLEATHGESHLLDSEENSESDMEKLEQTNFKKEENSD